MKTLVAIVRDHSGSMSHLVKGAMNDFNLIIQGIKDSKEPNDELLVSVVECGVGHRAENRLVQENIPVENIPRLATYSASGSGTPLFDAVGAAINALEIYSTNFNNDALAFLVMVITDGEENASRLFNRSSLTQKINSLQKTDRWTFAFRGPRDSMSQFRNLGIAEGNIMEWEQTNAGIAQSTAATTKGVSNYFKARSAGKTSINTFYADVKVSSKEIKEALTDETNKFTILDVTPFYNCTRIDDFINSRLSGIYRKGDAFYQLTKTEKAVQEYKEIALLDKLTGVIYTGTVNVRNLLGLPTYGTIKLVPGDHKNYDIFIQSTSLNRKLVCGTKVLYKK